MKNQKTRLFVVIDPTSSHQPALVKALLVAKLGGCELHAFLCIHKDMKESGAYASRKDFKRKTLAQASDWAFMIYTDTTVDYAAGRTRDHLANFDTDRLIQMLNRGFEFQRAHCA